MSWSNNPYSNQGGSYDRNVSIDAPRPPAQLWPGYDVSLLEGSQPQHSQYIQGLSGSETSTPPAAPLHPLLAQSEGYHYHHRYHRRRYRRRGGRSSRSDDENNTLPRRTVVLNTVVFC
ncbi:hypothetical protein EDD15DRAFT_2196730 [Pisolithus albus]|nr:hypothetical protein EDD15DRAFT_2196730 [Pisolithus albus]